MIRGGGYFYCIIILGFGRNYCIIHCCICCDSGGIIVVHLERISWLHYYVVIWDNFIDVHVMIWEDDIAGYQTCQIMT